MTYDRYEALKIERRDRILRVTINRPEALNGINQQLHEELGQIFDDIERDDATDVAILSGEGKAFCAGGDLDWLLRMQDKPTELMAVNRDDHRIALEAFQNKEKPRFTRR